MSKFEQTIQNIIFAKDTEERELLLSDETLNSDEYYKLSNEELQEVVGGVITDENMAYAKILVQAGKLDGLTMNEAIDNFAKCCEEMDLTEYLGATIPEMQSLIAKFWN